MQDMFDLRLIPHFAVYTLKCLEGGADNAVPTDCPVSENHTPLCYYDRTNKNHNDWNQDNLIKGCATLGELSVEVLDRIKLDRDACFKFRSGKDICYCKRDNCNNECKPDTECVHYVEGDKKVTICRDACKPYLAAGISTLKETCDAQCVSPRSAMSLATKASAASEVAVASKAPVTPKASSIPKAEEEEEEQEQEEKEEEEEEAPTSSGKPQNEVRTKTNSSNCVTPCTVFHVAISMFLIITREFD